MNIDSYLNNLNDEFNSYVNYCRDAINSLVLEDSLKGSIPGAQPIKRELNLLNVSDIEAIRVKRQQLIDVKVNHSSRVVENILKVSKNIGLNADFTKVVRIVALLHDIGRFEYATWNDAYSESGYRNQIGRDFFKYSKRFQELSVPIPARNHSEAGHILLTQKGVLKTYNEKFGFAKVIAQAVLHHQDCKLIGEFNPKNNRIDEHILKCNINDALRDIEGFNEVETQIYAVLTQLIKDVDCIDILYQHLTGEYPVIRPTIFFNKALRNYNGTEIIENQSLEEFSKRWGVSIEDILNYNGLTYEQASKVTRLALAPSMVDPQLFKMPDDLKEKFFNLEQIDLQEINKRYDFNPIMGMWWRLLQFLGQISFTSNLEVIKESELLDQILAMYPIEYRPNLEEAFSFAKTHLLEGRGTDIYAKNPFKK